MSFADLATNSVAGALQHVADLVTERMSQKSPLTRFRETQDPPMKKAELAKLLDVSRSVEHRWESGERKIGTDLLPRVSERTGIPKRELRPDLADAIQEPAQ